MMKSDYFDFAESATKLNYTKLPYTKVKHLLYTKHSFDISYKTTFNSSEFETVKTNSLKNKTLILKIPEVLPLNVVSKIKPEKIKDLKSMLQYMPPVDKAFFINLFLTHDDLATDKNPVVSADSVNEITEKEVAESSKTNIAKKNPTKNNKRKCDKKPIKNRQKKNLSHPNVRRNQQQRNQN